MHSSAGPRPHDVDLHNGSDSMVIRRLRGTDRRRRASRHICVRGMNGGARVSAAFALRWVPLGRQVAPRNPAAVDGACGETTVWERFKWAREYVSDGNKTVWQSGFSPGCETVKTANVYKSSSYR